MIKKVRRKKKRSISKRKKRIQRKEKKNEEGDRVKCIRITENDNNKKEENRRTKRKVNHDIFNKNQNFLYYEQSRGIKSLSLKSPEKCIWKLIRTMK